MQEALFYLTFWNIRKSGKQCLLHVDFNLSQKVLVFFQGNQMWKTRDQAKFFNRKRVQVLGKRALVCLCLFSQRYHLCLLCPNPISYFHT